MITYVKNGPVEESRSAAVRLSDARPSQMMGVANAQAMYRSTEDVKLLNIEHTM